MSEGCCFYKTTMEIRKFSSEISFIDLFQTKIQYVLAWATSDDLCLGVNRVIVFPFLISPVKVKTFHVLVFPFFLKEREDNS